MKNSLFVCTLLLALCACRSGQSISEQRSIPKTPPRGSINEYGQIKMSQPTVGSYNLEVIPFEARAFYKIKISETEEDSTECDRFPKDFQQIFKIEKRNLNQGFLHFARVCVYIDQGDSGATNLVLVNDKMFIAITAETIMSYQQ